MFIFASPESQSRRLLAGCSRSNKKYCTILQQTFAKRQPAADAARSLRGFRDGGRRRGVTGNGYENHREVRGRHTCKKQVALQWQPALLRPWRCAHRRSSVSTTCRTSSLTRRMNLRIGQRMFFFGFGWFRQFFTECSQMLANMS